MEIRSLDKSERLRIEVFTPGDENMMNLEGGQDGGLAAFGGLALNGSYQANDQIEITINNQLVTYRPGHDIVVQTEAMLKMMQQ